MARQIASCLTFVPARLDTYHHRKVSPDSERAGHMYASIESVPRLKEDIRFLGALGGRLL